MAGRRITVIGGANTDVVGRSVAVLVERDSNPGRVRVSSGGVARNVAENLARYGAATRLVSAFGGDHNAAELMRHCRELGIDIGGSVVCGDLPGSLYLAILDDAGDMALALNDMRALDRLTIDALRDAEASLSDADLVVSDANLTSEVLAWLVERTTAPVVLDPVSVAKAPRVRAVLSGLAAVKCNAAEAAALLAHAEPVGLAGVERLGAALLEAGVQRAYVTCGADGVFVASARESAWLPAPQVVVANATGAGDAFTAGVAVALAEGAASVEAGRFGSAFAALALSSDDTVSDLVSASTVAKMMEAAR